jgi:hypothetical protein
MRYPLARVMEALRAMGFNPSHEHGTFVSYMRIDANETSIVILDGGTPDMAEDELVRALRLAKVHVETFWARYYSV